MIIRTISQRIELRIQLSKKGVFLRGDFTDIAGYDQVGRCLRLLVGAGKLVKIGQGLYTAARASRVSGKPTIAMKGGFKQAVGIALTRLKVKWQLSSAFLDYNNQKTTQIPANLEIVIPKTFKRSIYFKGLSVRFIAEGTLGASLGA